jgi:ketosteroid isomerase-like protein
MALVRRLALSAAFALSSSCGGGERAGPAEDPADELERLTQENLDAIAPGDVEVWRRNAHEDLVHVDEEGKVRSKEELLAELEPLPAGLSGRLVVDEFAVAVHGDTAIATHVDQEFLDYHGQALKSRWRTTDTWVKTPTGWRLAAQQILALQVDPQSISLPREAMCAYNGTYRLTAAISAKAACTAEGLRFERTDRPAQLYKAEVADVFFAPGSPRTRRIFERNGRGEITGFVDRREGHDVRWRKVD